MTISENPSLYTPAQFRQDYTKEYLRGTIDSPEESRKSLIKLLTISIFHRLNSYKTPTLKILNIGAGTQVLEYELQQKKEFQQIKKTTQIITLDIADLTKDQLMAENIPHTQANAQYLPYKKSSFDIIASNLALDFIPRQVFGEINRVLKPKGELIANLSHPNLHNNAKICDSRLDDKLLQITQRIYQANIYKKGISKAEELKKLETKRQEILDEKKVVDFYLHNYPAHAFPSLKDLRIFLEVNFKNYTIDTQEIINNWYQVRLVKP